jgi:nitrite reductase/ring-hydroxylating ferredoxin subunit/uncharacterized membrane protein
MAESRTDRLIRSQGWLDPVGEVIQNIVGGIYGGLRGPGRGLKNLLHGTTVLGHPLHPALTDVPLGAWTVGVVADYAAYVNHAVPTQVGDFALGLGILSALAAALAGYTDHHDTFGHERRVATLHGLLMTTTVLIMVISLVFRWTGGVRLHGLAVGLSTIGYLLALTGAYLGGHLTYGIGTMVNRNAFATGPDDFVTVGRDGDFREGELRKVEANGMPVLVTRVRGRLLAVANTCSHAGGPLNEGSLDGEIVTCPWHQSEFRLSDGSVKGGPATFPLPVMEVRERGGQVEVRLGQPLH